MAIQGRICDNFSRKVNEVFPCLVDTPALAEKPAFKHFLDEIGGCSLVDLLNRNPRLLVFPKILEMVEDDIGRNSIFCCDGDSITTGNVMGFVGKGGVSLSIASRFYNNQNDDNQNDYFLHYLLQKVVGFHAVDLPTPHNADPVWDFLPYLFPSSFMAAWKQGVFKLCRRFNANDDRIKGTIDIAQHIRSNIPFRGQIAYSFSERTTYNPINQLIRLTINVLEHSVRFKAMFHGDNKEFNDAIRDLKAMVPVELIGNRSIIIKDNLRPVSHPLYLKYQPLQKLCLAILRHEKMSFAGNDEDVVGLLFDGSWLWEEYLARVMPPEITHAENKTRRHGIYALAQRIWPSWYPDFYSKSNSPGNALVFDAKYKRYVNNKVDPSDQHQIVSYMYVLKSDIGGFLLPSPASDDSGQMFNPLGALNGHGGKMFICRYPIPDKCVTFADYISRMEGTEDRFRKEVQAMIHLIK